MSFRLESLALFRILIPSWRFFEDAGDVPSISYQLIQQSQTESWLPALQPPRTGFLNLFFNQEVNIYLAVCGTVDKLIEEINQSPNDFDASASTSYQILLLFLQNELRAQPEMKASSFRFKIQVTSLSSVDQPTYCSLMSEEHSIW